MQTQNQEDRKLYEEASVDLYQSTPDSEPAKRHGILKPTIDGKMPKPWMSMKSSGRLDTAVPAHLQTPRPQAQAVLQQRRLLGSAPAAMVQAAMRTPAAAQHQQSDQLDMVPHGEGLFGRQRAAKRQHSHIAITSEDRTPIASAPVIASSFTTGIPQPTPAAKQSSAPILETYRGKKTQAAQTAGKSTPEQRGFDALDRLNARKGYGNLATLPSSHRLLQPAKHSKALKGNQLAADATAAITAQASLPIQSPASAESQPRQLHQEALRPIDALDRFNKRHKSQGKTHEALPPHGSRSAHQQPDQSRRTAEGQAQRPLDALARFNMRKGHKPFGTNSPVTNPDVQEIDVDLPAKEDTAAESQQSQTTSVELEQVLPMQTRSIIAKESSESSQTPDALDKLNSVLLQRRQQRLGKQAQSVPVHARKRMRAFDDDLGPHDGAQASLQVQSEPRTSIHQHQVLTGPSAARLSSVSDRLSARLGKITGV